jgi:hypothetical protein
MVSAAAVIAILAAVMLRERPVYRVYIAPPKDTMEEIWNEREWTKARDGFCRTYLWELTEDSTRWAAPLTREERSKLETCEIAFGIGARWRAERFDRENTNGQFEDSKTK